MKRKVFNSVNTPSVKATGLFLRISPKSGQFNFSRELADKLKLDSHRINIIQDEEKPADWFIEVTKDDAAFLVRRKKETDVPQYVMQSTFLAREILKESKLPEESTRFMVASEPIERNLFAILTKSAKK